MDFRLRESADGKRPMAKIGVTFHVDLGDLWYALQKKADLTAFESVNTETTENIWTDEYQEIAVKWLEKLSKRRAEDAFRDVLYNYGLDTERWDLDTLDNLPDRRALEETARQAVMRLFRFDPFTQAPAAAIEAFHAAAAASQTPTTSEV